MALTIDDYRKPKFIKYRSEATLSRDDQARFDIMVYGGDNVRHWRAEPQPGYSADNPTIRPIKINLKADIKSLPKSVR